MLSTLARSSWKTRLLARFLVGILSLSSGLSPLLAQELPFSGVSRSQRFGGYLPLVDWSASILPTPMQEPLENFFQKRVVWGLGGALGGATLTRAALHWAPIPAPLKIGAGYGARLAGFEAGANSVHALRPGIVASQIVTATALHYGLTAILPTVLGSVGLAALSPIVVTGLALFGAFLLAETLKKLFPDPREVEARALAQEVREFYADSAWSAPSTWSPEERSQSPTRGADLPGSEALSPSILGVPSTFPEEES